MIPAENSVSTPAGVRRPISPWYSGNQRLPSGPATIEVSPDVVVTGSSVMTPAVVTRAMTLRYVPTK